MEWTPEQAAVIERPGNILVLANAGTGKTATLVEKLALEITNRRDHRGIIAITFTRKAYSEIRNRLPLRLNSSFVSTINQFAFQEIVKPFIKDAAKQSHCQNLILPRNLEITIDYSSKCSKQTIEELCEQLRITGIIGTYSKPNSNFLYQLAFFVISNSLACRLYLRAKYFKIFVDEYQDCDESMHKLFMYLNKKLQIDIAAFGDPKQFIYGWRGANINCINEMRTLTTFSELLLTKNFRSHQSIQNYSNLLYPNETSILFSKSSDKSMVFLARDFKSVYSHWNHSTSSIAILRRKNSDVETTAEFANRFGLEFEIVKSPPVADIYSDDEWLYFELARYFYIEEATVYTILSEAPFYFLDVIRPKQLKDILNPIKSLNIQSENFRTAIENVVSLFGYVWSDDSFSKLFQTLQDDSYKAAFKQDERKSVALTIHSSKGMEFDSVILFSSDFISYRRYGSSRTFLETDLHYVAATRARRSLYIIDDCPVFVGHIQNLFAQSNHRIDEVCIHI